MSAEGFLRNTSRLAFVEDWPLKLVCLILATLYWVYIDGQLTGKREMTIHVSLAGITLPTGLDLHFRIFRLLGQGGAGPARP